MTLLAIVLIVCVLVSTVGDVLLARAMRIQQPGAFAAAGFPSPEHLALYSPLVMRKYFSFILRREFTQFLPPSSRLRTFANFLYVIHVLLIGTAMLGVTAQYASLSLFTGRGGS